MTPTELHEVLLARYDSQARTLTLPASALAGSPAAAAIQGHCRASVLELTGAAAPKLDGERVTISAESAASIESVAVAAKAATSWGVADGQVHMRLLLTPAGQTAQGVALQELHPPLASAVTGAYRFADVTLTIDSAAAPFDFDALQEELAPGVYLRPADSRTSGPLLFTGKFLYPERLQGLAFLSQTHESPVAGSLRLVNGVPQYGLRVRPTRVSIGHLTFEIGLELIGLLVEPAEGERPEVDAVHRLVAQLHVESSASVLSFETTWQIATPTAFEIVSRDIAGVSGLLRDLGATLLNVEIPDWSAVEQLPWGDTFRLTAMHVGFNAEALRLDFASATFALLDRSRNLTLIPELLTLDSIVIELAGMPGPPAQLEAVLTGNLAIHDTSVTGPFEVEVMLPGGSFRIGLGSGSTLDAGRLLRRLIPQLPESTSWIIDDLSVAGSWTERSLTFSAAFEADTSIDLLLFRLEDLSLFFEYSGASGVSAATVQLAGVLRISDRVTIALSGALHGDGWSFSGSFEADPPVTLAELLPAGVKLPSELASCEIRRAEVTAATAGGKEIAFALDAVLKLDFHDAGEISTGALQLKYESTADGYAWTIEASGGLKLVRTDESKWFFDCSGTLRVEGTKETAALHFDSDGCGFNDLPLLVPAKIDAGAITWSAISFLVTRIDLEKDGDDWHFASDFRLRLTRAFPQLMRIFPADGVDAELKIEKGAARIHLKQPVLSIDVPDFPLPAVGDLPPFAMGESRVELGPLKLLLGGKEIAIECDVAFWLPSRVNHLLGTEPDTGKPKIELFETFRRDTPGRAVRARFHGGYQAGHLDLGGSVSDLPIHSLQPEGNGHVLHLGEVTDGLGRYGSMKFEMPALSVDLQKGGLELSGAFELLKDFAIPLDAVKAMLAAGSASRWASQLPDVLPIPYLARPSLFADGALNVAAIDGYYQKLFGVPLPAAASTALQALVDVAAHLPERLAKYLELSKPSAMRFALDVRPNGSVDVTVAATPDVRLVLFSPAGGVQGITLRSLTFGEWFVGQLFSLRIDADVEQFDVVQLATALAIRDEAVWKYVGNPHQFGTRVELHELFVAIFWQTGIPIPVPLFAEKLGVDAYGLGDFALQAAIAFPEPSLDLAAAGTLLGDIIHFVTDRNFALDPAKEHGGLDLQLTIQPSYVTLPEVMGKSKHGLREPWKPPSAYQAFASIANALKFANVGDVIRAVPLDQRFLSRDSGARVNFAGIDVAVESIVTNPREFLGAGREKLGLADGEAMWLLAILRRANGEPVTPQHDDLVVFARGDWETSYARFEVVFGLGAMPLSRMHMGMRISGDVNGIFDIMALASTRISDQPPYFILGGESTTNLTIAGLPIFAGETTLADGGTHLNLAGTFSLLDETSVVSLRGRVSGSFSSSEFQLSGNVRARLLSFELEGSVSISHTGIMGEIGTSGLPATHFGIGREGNGVRVDGEFGLAWTRFRFSIVYYVDSVQIQMTSSALMDLLVLDLDFKTNPEAQDAEGRFTLSVFRTPVLSTTATFVSGALSTAGHFAYYLAAGVGIEVSVSGRIDRIGFALSGTGTLQVLLTSASCSITIAHDGIRGDVTLMGIDYRLAVILCNGIPIILLRAGEITSYIDSSGFHFGQHPPCDIPPEPWVPSADGPYAK